ncbi:MAG: hypothetical protein R3C49_03425 [Planctomycetaceae bacterium]
MLRMPLVLCVLVLATLPLSPHSGELRAQTRTAQQTQRAQFEQRRQEILLNLRHELSELSRTCHEQGQTQAASDITALSLDLTTSGTETVLPQLVQLPLSQNLPDEQKLWRNRVAFLREEKGQELYRLARQALRNDQPTLAYDLVKDTLRLNPDHEDSRAVLGQQLFRDPTRVDDATYAGEWVSPFEARRRTGSNPETDHPEFGWIPVRLISRYEAGERPWRGNWVSVQKEAELRRNFQNAWEIRTEHFLVKTNTSLEQGVQISRKLELFHNWLTTHFAAFFETPDALEERFQEAQSRRRVYRDPKPMEVHYYATREEYDRRIQSKNPLLAQVVTNGLYWEPDRTCYFFLNPDDPELRTVFHEATHQIFDLATADDRLSAARKRQIVLRERQARPWVMCEKSNFWMLEGIACYFESLEIHDGVISAGNPDYTRFVAAQQRMLNDNFFIPLQTFSSLGKDDFQHHPNLPQLYSQASGVAHFLLHYDNGIYRDDFVKLLSAAYRPDLKNVTAEPSLEKITGVRFAVLDQQYRDHLATMNAE